jgi:hypothetical protein
MRLPDYLAVAFVGFTTLALVICGVSRARDVAGRVQMGKPPVRGQQPDHLPSEQRYLNELLDQGKGWRENELYIRQRSEP